MSFWLLKTEPDEFGWTDQLARGANGEMWTGVRNAQARNFLKSMTPGDRAFFYHTGDERQIVGIVEVTSQPEPDPTDPVWIAVRVVAVAGLVRPVRLADIKRAAADPDDALAALVLVRNSRLSVQPVRPDEWAALIAMAGGETDLPAGPG